VRRKGGDEPKRIAWRGTDRLCSWGSARPIIQAEGPDLPLGRAVSGSSNNRVRESLPWEQEDQNTVALGGV